uniref:Uncharacterized protein n=1 Tax=Candidatus Kentrum sp. LPFa TaxID=2126335 RepID=A0A450X325_9GAMM|nr:MAG: hypothetical protein BECKLPF1236B_GA0070989_13742 [Candidatus Kentron sp. LPFa]
MVDARSDPPYGPESGLLFHSNGSLLARDYAPLVRGEASLVQFVIIRFTTIKRIE